MGMKHITREMKVKEFHKDMGHPIAEDLEPIGLILRRGLINEECEEVSGAFSDILSAKFNGNEPTKEQWAHLLKELADLQYVLSGTIVSIGAISGDFDAAFNRVHRSNMSKLDEEGKPIYNENGKVLKGPNYKKPDLTDLIKEN